MIHENASARAEDGWFVSSFTNGGGSCVEVRFAERGTILVRDSKDLRSATPVMSVPAPGWTSLLRNIGHYA